VPVDPPGRAPGRVPYLNIGAPNCISGQNGNIVGGVLMPVWMIVLGWLAVGACFLSPPGARAQVGPDLPPLLPSPGRVIADYLAASSQRALRLLTAEQALNRCGQCADRARLQEEYDRLQEEERQVRAGEGIVMQSLHLPYNDFRELAKDLFLGLRPGYDQMPKEVRDARIAMSRTIGNYCYVVSETPDEENVCRKVYALNQVNDILINAPKRCFSAVQAETGVKLNTFPAPEAPASEVNAHDAAWRKYKDCVQGSDLFQMMRVYTNKACGVADIGPSLDRDQFICACKGRVPPADKACPATGAAPPPSVVQSQALIHPPPAERLLDPQSSPNLVGIHLGMPMSAAEALIRKHMDVGEEYTTGVADKGAMVPRIGHQNTSGVEANTQGLRGRLFISADNYEYIAIFDAPPNLPGRVVAVSRVLWVPGGAAQKEIADLVASNGNPAGPLTAPVVTWGDISVGACAPTTNAIWDSAIWVKDHVSLEERRKDATVVPVRDMLVPRLPYGWRTDPWDCRPVVTFRSEGDPKRPGRPLDLTEKLYDMGLLAWFKDQHCSGSSERCSFP
jgi:hypothetical protein